MLNTIIQYHENGEIKNVNMMDYYSGYLAAINSLVESNDEDGAINILLDTDPETSDLLKVIELRFDDDEQLKEVIKKADSYR